MLPTSAPGPRPRVFNGEAASSRKLTTYRVSRCIAFSILALLLGWASTMAWVFIRSAVTKSGPAAAKEHKPGIAVRSLGANAVAAAAGAAATTPWPPESTVQCAMWGTWTEICHYENVCFDGHERALFFYKNPDSPNTGILPTGAQDWSTTAAAMGAGGDSDVPDVPEPPYIDPSTRLPVYSPRRWHISHGDLLTGQVLPLTQFPRYGLSRPKLFPFNSNMKGRFISLENATDYWRRTAADWLRQACDVDTVDLSDEEALEVINGGSTVCGALSLRGGGGGGDGSSTAADGGGGGGSGMDAVSPVEDTALVFSHKVQLQNIWYYSSRAIPWFEARRFNNSGMLPFLLPQPAVAYLHTTENLVGSDWHRSFLALAMGLPKYVLFPEQYGPPPTPSPTPTQTRTPAKARRPSVTPSSAPAEHLIVEYPNGARFWAGMRVPRLLYRLIEGKLWMPGVAQLSSGGGGKGHGGAASGDDTGAAGEGEDADAALAGGGGGAGESGGGAGDGAGGEEEGAGGGATGLRLLLTQVEVGGEDEGAKGRRLLLLEEHQLQPQQRSASSPSSSPLSAVRVFSTTTSTSPLSAVREYSRNAAASRARAGAGPKLKLATSAGVAGNRRHQLEDTGPKLKLTTHQSEGAVAAAAEALAARVNDASAAGLSDASAALSGIATAAAVAAAAQVRVQSTTSSNNAAVEQQQAQQQTQLQLPGRRLLWKVSKEPTANAAKPDPNGGYVAAVAGSFVVTDESDIDAARAAAAQASVRPPSSRRAKSPSQTASATMLANAGEAELRRRLVEKAAAGVSTAGSSTTSTSFRDAFLPDGTPNPNADEERVRCYRKLTLTGASGFVFGDTYSASEFRSRALASIGRHDQPKFIGPGVASFYGAHLPPKKVLLIDRKKGKPRHINNVDQIIELLDHYEIPYTHLVDFRGSFEEQVAIYNDHGILLGVHGAGFINCMFMRQGSAVVEVFPYHVKHTLYMRQAYASGLTHFSVYATDRTGIFKRGNALHAYLDKKCDTWPSVMTQWKDNACRGPLIGASITVPMRPLEEAIVNALDMIGYRTQYKGMFNDEHMASAADNVQSLEDMLGEYQPSPRPSKGPDGKYVSPSSKPTRVPKGKAPAVTPSASRIGGGGGAAAAATASTAGKGKAPPSEVEIASSAGKGKAGSKISRAPSADVEVAAAASDVKVAAAAVEGPSPSRTVSTIAAVVKKGGKKGKPAVAAPAAGAVAVAAAVGEGKPLAAAAAAAAEPQLEPADAPHVGDPLSNGAVQPPLPAAELQLADAPPPDSELQLEPEIDPADSLAQAAAAEDAAAAAAAAEDAAAVLEEAAGGSNVEAANAVQQPGLVGD